MSPLGLLFAAVGAASCYFGVGLVTNRGGRRDRYVDASQRGEDFFGKLFVRAQSPADAKSNGWMFILIGVLFVAVGAFA
jgi:hypothetical protein